MESWKILAGHRKTHVEIGMTESVATKESASSAPAGVESVIIRDGVVFDPCCADRFDYTPRRLTD
jgi:hypothetical protein